jgi:hypothetical protein
VGGIALLFEGYSVNTALAPSGWNVGQHKFDKESQKDSGEGQHQQQTDTRPGEFKQLPPRGIENRNGAVLYRKTTKVLYRIHSFSRLGT